MLYQPELCLLLTTSPTLPWLRLSQHCIATTHNHNIRTAQHNTTPLYWEYYTMSVRQGYIIGYISFHYNTLLLKLAEVISFPGAGRKSYSFPNSSGRCPHINLVPELHFPSISLVSNVLGNVILQVSSVLILVSLLSFVFRSLYHMWTDWPSDSILLQAVVGTIEGCWTLRPNERKCVVLYLMWLCILVCSRLPLLYYHQ